MPSRGTMRTHTELAESILLEQESPTDLLVRPCRCCGLPRCALALDAGGGRPSERPSVKTLPVTPLGGTVSMTVVKPPSECGGQRAARFRITVRASRRECGRAHLELAESVLLEQGPPTDLLCRSATTPAALARDRHYDRRNTSSVPAAGTITMTVIKSPSSVPRSMGCR